MRLVNIERDIQFTKPFNIHQLNVHALVFISVSLVPSLRLLISDVVVVVVANDIFFRMLTHLTNNSTFTDYTLNTVSFHRYRERKVFALTL